MDHGVRSCSRLARLSSSEVAHKASSPALLCSLLSPHLTPIWFVYPSIAWFSSQINTVSGIPAAQLYAIGVCLFLSFLNWVIVIRNYNHLTFHHFNDVEDAIFQSNEKLKEDATRVSKSLMSRATVHHYIGTRCFYLIIVILGWKISPTGMLAASILLVPWLAYHDFV